jgi:glycosidase
MKNNMKAISTILVVLIIACSLVAFVACDKPAEPQPVEPHVPVADPIDDNYRVFYQIFVGSFSDSNGDGTGDIRGIINRFDYLNDGDIADSDSLGVQGIWLTPIYLSNTYHKYDAINYYTIDPKFGTMEDLEELIALCHERNVKLILDLPINHTALSNSWFQQFAQAHKVGDVENQYYDYYVYGTINDFVGKKYNSIPGCTGEYYECNFDSGMPELNFDNPEVRQAVLDVAKFYLDKGIDGFRFDAIKYIYYGETQKSVDFWKWYMGELTAYKEDIYCVGECWSADAETLRYVEALNCFNFQLASSGVEGYIARTAKGGNLATYTNYLQNYQASVLESNPNGMVMSFLSNHDNDRIAGALTVSSGTMFMGANLNILTPGSPFIYYGEEIGLKGSRGSSNTDANRRLAMLWGDDDTVKNPYGSTYASKYQTNGTVAEHLANPTSLLQHYEKLINVRTKYPEIARGTYTALTYSTSKFGGFKVEYNGSVIGIFHNVSTEPITIDLASATQGGVNFTTLLETLGFGFNGATLNGTILTIPALSSVIVG